MKSNFLKKLAKYDGTIYLQSSLRKLAVSESFEMLELTPSLREIASKVHRFVLKESTEYKGEAGSHKDVIDYDIQLTRLFVNMTLDKYKQLVLPYIDGKGFNFDYDKLYRPGQRQSDPFYYLLLHDLIHETIRPGSNVTFRKIDDKEKDDRKKNILLGLNKEELKDVRKITRDKIPYSLEQFIEEDVAVRISSVRDNKSRESFPGFGIRTYVDYMMISILNEVFGTKFQLTDYIEHLVAPEEIGKIFNFFQKLVEYIERDIKKIKNTKYKEVATAYLHSLKGWIRNLNEKVLHNRIPNGIKMQDLIETILIKTLNWCSIKFNFPNIFSREDFPRKDILIDDPGTGRNLLQERVTHKESPIQSLTDERKMSLLRRWLRAVHIGVNKIITEHNRDEYNSRINIPPSTN